MHLEAPHPHLRQALQALCAPLHPLKVGLSRPIESYYSLTALQRYNLLQQLRPAQTQGHGRLYWVTGHSLSAMSPYINAGYCLCNQVMRWSRLWRPGAQAPCQCQAALAPLRMPLTSCSGRALPALMSCSSRVMQACLPCPATCPKEPSHTMLLPAPWRATCCPCDLPARHNSARLR
jgi:hypothetical protein